METQKHNLQSSFLQSEQCQSCSHTFGHMEEQACAAQTIRCVHTYAEKHPFMYRTIQYIHGGKETTRGGRGNAVQKKNPTGFQKQWNALKGNCPGFVNEVKYF